MSDRFKFRCWDKESSEYIQWGWNPDYGLELDFTTGKLIWQSVPDGEDEYPKELDTKQLVVEQCTGVKDKNGNLIYESDVIKCDDEKGIIKFGFYRRAYEHFPNSTYGFYIEWCNSKCQFRQDFGYWTTEERIEITGNIHETKDNQ